MRCWVARLWACMRPAVPHGISNPRRQAALPRHGGLQSLPSYAGLPKRCLDRRMKACSAWRDSPSVSASIQTRSCRRNLESVASGNADEAAVDLLRFGSNRRRDCEARDNQENCLADGRARRKFLTATHDDRHGAIKCVRHTEEFRCSRPSR